MKGFINLKELKLERNQMNVIIGGANNLLVAPKEIGNPNFPVLRYAIMPLYGIKPVTQPRYGVETPRA